MNVTRMASILGRLHPEAYDALFPQYWEGRQYREGVGRAAAEVNPQPLPPRRDVRGSAQAAVVEAVRSMAELVVSANAISGSGAATQMLQDWDGDICPPWWPIRWPFPPKGGPTPDPDPYPWLTTSEISGITGLTLAVVAEEITDAKLAAAFTGAAERALGAAARG